MKGINQQRGHEGGFSTDQEVISKIGSVEPAHIKRGCLFKHQRGQERATDVRHRCRRGQVSDMLPVLLLLCACFSGRVWGSAPTAWGYSRIPDRQGPVAPLCPSPCQCEQDGIYVMVDCSELGLSSVPANLSPLTTYL